MEKFADFRRAGKTVVVVSHAMGSLRTLCDEAAWLEHGKLVDVGEASDIVESYIEAGHVKRADGAAGQVVGERSGSGEVVLTKVELLNADGKPTNTVHSADEIVVRMHYRADKRIERPLFALSLDTLAGVHVWAHNSRDGNCTPDSIMGEGSVEIRIPRLSLQAGTFDLHASINDYLWAHPYDRWRFCLRFDILDRPNHDGGGIVDLGGSWTLPADQKVAY